MTSTPDHGVGTHPRPQRGRIVQPRGPRRGHVLPVSPELERIARLADALDAGMRRAHEPLDRNGLIEAIVPFVRHVDPADLISAVAVLVADGRAIAVDTNRWQVAP